MMSDLLEIMHDGDEYAIDWRLWIKDAEIVREAARHLLAEGDSVGFYPTVETHLVKAIEHLSDAHAIEAVMKDHINPDEEVNDD